MSYNEGNGREKTNAKLVGERWRNKNSAYQKSVKSESVIKRRGESIEVDAEGTDFEHWDIRMSQRSRRNSYEYFDVKPNSCEKLKEEFNYHRTVEGDLN